MLSILHEGSGDLRELDDGTLLAFDDDKVRVYVNGVHMATIPLGPYQLVRPDHDALIMGKKTVWRRESRRKESKVK